MGPSSWQRPLGSPDLKSHLMQGSSAQDSWSVVSQPLLGNFKDLSGRHRVAALRPLSRTDLATQHQGMWLAANPKLLVSSESAWAFELRSVPSGSPQPMAEQGGGTTSCPLLPNVGLLSQAIFALELHVGLADLIWPVSQSEGCSVQSCFLFFSFPRCYSSISLNTWSAGDFFRV